MDQRKLGAVVLTGNEGHFTKKNRPRLLMQKTELFEVSRSRKMNDFESETWLLADILR